MIKTRAAYSINTEIAETCKSKPAAGRHASMNITMLSKRLTFTVLERYGSGPYCVQELNISVI